MSPALQAFEIELPIEAADLDQLGHVNNVTYVRWVQDVAVAHWQAVAPAADQAKVRWIVLRHEIDYLRQAVPGDRIIARTWVGNGTRVRFERFTELLRAADRMLLAKAHHVVPDRRGEPQAGGRERRSARSLYGFH